MIDKRVEFLDLGTAADYEATWARQEHIFNAMIAAKVNPVLMAKPALIFCEHPHVYTLGKSGDENNLLVNYIELQAKEASFVKTNRGGDITYHGPGQLVGYPILDLEAYGIGVREYIYRMEEAVILAMQDYGIATKRLEGASGVWLQVGEHEVERKICAIGVKVSRYVSMHGFALNVNTNLNYFKYINPCGFTDKVATSMQAELGKEVDMRLVKTKVKQKLAEVFGFTFL